MKPRFRFEDYRYGYVMNCETEDEAITFCKFMDKHGKTWADDKSYLKDNKWQINKTNTCYNFRNGRVGEIEFYRQIYCKVLKYSDFNWSKQFIKSDLQDFDFVVTRNHEIYFFNAKFDIIIDKNGNYLQYGYYKHDLKHEDISRYDIMKVYRPIKKSHCTFNDYDSGELIYERSE